MEFDLKNKELVAGLHRKVAHALYMSKKIISDYADVATKAKENGEEVDGLLAVSLTAAIEMVTVVSVLSGLCLKNDLLDRGTLDMVLAEHLEEKDSKHMAVFLDLITKDSNLFSIGEDNDAPRH